MSREDDRMITDLLRCSTPGPAWPSSSASASHDGRKRSYREVGEELGVTAEAARRLVKRAVDRRPRAGRRAHRRRLSHPFRHDAPALPRGRRRARARSPCRPRKLAPRPGLAAVSSTAPASAPVRLCADRSERPPFSVASTWTPTSWRGPPAAQQPDWPDTPTSIASPRSCPPIPRSCSPARPATSPTALARVADGEAFLLQAGDCAESFDAFSADAIRDKLQVILQMAVVLTYSSGVPVVKVGRIAGQFAKPRSAGTETIDGVELPSFRGHIVNDIAFTAAARQPDPERLLTAYNQSAATLNLVRAFTKGGFADLSRVHSWNQEFVASARGPALRAGRRRDRPGAAVHEGLRHRPPTSDPLHTSTSTPATRR